MKVVYYDKEGRLSARHEDIEDSIQFYQSQGAAIYQFLLTLPQKTKNEFFWLILTNERDCYGVTDK
jgi:hypothetical protein